MLAKTLSYHEIADLDRKAKLAFTTFLTYNGYMKTLTDIKNFTEGTVVTQICSEDFDYPFYFLGEDRLGWAEYVDLSNFNIFKLLGFTEEIYSVEDERDYDSEAEELYEIVGDSSLSLQELLAIISKTGSGFTVEKI